MHLRDAIVAGTLPPGAPLREADLARGLGVERRSIHDALVRLTLGGLVTTRGRGNQVVTEADLDAALDAQIVVSQMHRLAIMHAVPRMTQSDIAAMRQENDRFAAAIVEGDVQEALAADHAFHDVAVGASGNKTLAMVLEQYEPLVLRLEMRTFQAAGGQSARMHGQIIEACAAGDVVAATAVVELMWSRLREGLEGQAGGR